MARYIRLDNAIQTQNGMILVDGKAEIIDSDEIYQQGYADGSLSVTSEILEHNDLYQQGRADTIEELKNKADCKNSECYNCAMADGDMNCMLGINSNLFQKGV